MKKISPQDFETNVARYIAENHQLMAGDKVLVALSGGSDSVALLRVLLCLGYECVAAHCNFHLRGEESNRDQHFVENLCSQCNVPIELVHFDVPVYVKEHGVSIEMACRDLRYAWFEETRLKHACKSIAVAHHRDDNVETFFLNAIRGTGIAGLTGMKPVNCNIIRPFLSVSHAQILDYLSSIKQNFVVDSTNLKNDVKRNQLRNIVLPLLYEQFPDSSETLNSTIQHTFSDYQLYQELLKNEVSKFVEKLDDSIKIGKLPLLSFANSEVLLYEILKPYGFNFTQCKNVISSLQNQQDGVGSHFYSSTSTLTIGRDNLQVFLLKETLEVSYDINLKNKTITLPIKLEVQRVLNQNFKPSSCDGMKKVAFDSAILSCHQLTIRHWRSGDRFRPFGMNGSKLLSDLFTDLKLDEREKKMVWLLEADGEIVWVIGYRASEKFRVKKDSKDFVLLSLDDELK